MAPDGDVDLLLFTIGILFLTNSYVDVNKGSHHQAIIINNGQPTEAPQMANGIHSRDIFVTNYPYEDRNILWTHTNNFSDPMFLFNKPENQLPVVHSPHAKPPPSNSGIAANSIMQVNYHYYPNANVLQPMDKYVAHRTQTNHATPSLSRHIIGERNIISVQMIMVLVVNLPSNFPQIALINLWTHTNNLPDNLFLLTKSENQLPVVNPTRLANYPSTNNGSAANSNTQARYYWSQFINRYVKYDGAVTLIVLIFCLK